MLVRLQFMNAANPCNIVAAENCNRAGTVTRAGCEARARQL